MSWNGSDHVGAASSSHPKNGEKSHSSTSHFNWKALVAVVIVVIGTLTAWFLLSRPASNAIVPQADTGSKLIKEKASAKSVQVAPSPDMVLSTNRLGEVVEHPPTNKWGNPWHWGPNKKLKPRRVSRLDRSALPLYEQIFENSADRTIAGLLVMEPGTQIIGSDEPSPWFAKSFLQSLKTPIIVTKDDSEEVAALKRAVNETKIELKARHDAGEDIAKIIADTRREMRELGAYREELKKQVDEYRRKGNITSEDLKDMVEAANKMLQERGAKKIVMPEVYYKQIELKNRLNNERSEK